ncbi:MAG: hypothetical protein NVSMB38_34570 [Ktedonobacteraceae bacterium]
MTSWHGRVYVSDFDIVSPHSSRILVFNADGSQLIQVLGGKPGEELISNGALLGLTIDRRTRTLYAAANTTGQILQIRNPESLHPHVSVYATYPKGGGPEDLAFNKQGVLYASDSNLGVIYSIPSGGGKLNLVVGPSGSGAPVSDKGLLYSVEGGSPNGLVFSLDYRTLYANNLGTDSVIAFDVNKQGQVTGNARVFAQHFNDDLEEYPTGDPSLIRPDTHIGASASTPLNGADGLALDSKGHIWVASALGDNLTVLNPKTGAVVATYGKSAVTQHGLLNNPASITFVNDRVLCTNLNFFVPQLPFTVVSFDAGVAGAGGNGNY